MTRWRGIVRVLLGGTLGVGAPAQAADVQAAPRTMTTGVFAPAIDRPMILTRSVIRALHDGRRIVATRRYRVLFQRDGGGFRINGALVASEVEAPEALRALAEIERGRPDDGLFPIRLDGAGLIVADGAGRAMGNGDRAAVDEALLIGARMLASRPSDAGREQDAAFIAQLRAAMLAPATAHWPAALFVPGSGVERQERMFALPGGGEGRFVAEVRRMPARDGGVMAGAERRITTTIGDDDSVSLEQWTLVPEG